jgi:Protein of unknown function (DUF4244)
MIRKLRRLVRDDAGMTTAEYAVGTIVPVGPSSRQSMPGATAPPHACPRASAQAEARDRVGITLGAGRVEGGARRSARVCRTGPRAGAGAGRRRQDGLQRTRVVPAAGRGADRAGSAAGCLGVGQAAVMVADGAAAAGHLGEVGRLASAAPARCAASTPCRAASSGTRHRTVIRSSASRSDAYDGGVDLGRQVDLDHASIVAAPSDTSGCCAVPVICSTSGRTSSWSA